MNEGRRMRRQQRIQPHTTRLLAYPYSLASTRPTVMPVTTITITIHINSRSTGTPARVEITPPHLSGFSPAPQELLAVDDGLNSLTRADAVVSASEVPERFDDTGVSPKALVLVPSGGSRFGGDGSGRCWRCWRCCFVETLRFFSFSMARLLLFSSTLNVYWMGEALLSMARASPCVFVLHTPPLFSAEALVVPLLLPLLLWLLLLLLLLLLLSL